MTDPTPKTLRASAKRCHELAPSLSKVSDRSALDDYAEVLAQQARDLEARGPSEAPATKGGAG